jgi:hypothetical protein
MLFLPSELIEEAPKAEIVKEGKTTKTRLIYTAPTQHDRYGEYTFEDEDC